MNVLGGTTDFFGLDIEAHLGAFGPAAQLWCYKALVKVCLHAARW